MNIALAQPWALLGLLALPLIVYLHRHVIETRRVEVSSLWLWRDGAPTRHEGRSLRRVPERLVLLLELLAALCLVLLCAGVEFTLPTEQQPHAVLIIDASASMSGGGASGPAPIEQARAELARLSREHPGLTVTLVSAGEQPKLLGERQLSATAARERLAAFEPQASASRIDLALELASALGAPAGNTLVISDDPELEHVRLLRVGQPAANTGLIAAGWPAGGTPFVAVHNFGKEAVDLRLAVEVDSGHRSSVALALAPDAERALEFPIDARASRLELTLPDDALRLDNHVTLLRPPERRVGVASSNLSPPLARAVERAVRAIPKLRATDASQAALLVAENPQQPVAGALLAFLTRPTGVAQPAFDLQPDPFAPLLAGVQVRDLLWHAWDSHVPAGARVLLRGGTRALIWRSLRGVYVNIKLERSNLLDHPAFPIVIANLADEVDAALGGLPDHNFAQGSRLRFQPAPDFGADIVLHSPSGRRTHYTKSGPIDFGVLDEAGVYSLRAGDRQQVFASALLSPHESNLMQRKAANAGTPPLALESRKLDDAPGDARVPLLLTVLASLVAAYGLLLGWPRVLRARRR